ncbi:MAG: hypothetical protein Q9168_004939 [Polycauliona sp. 1 TL-2023]
MSTQGIPSSSVLPPAPETWLFQRIELYPFSTDQEFQSGLSTILSSNPAKGPELLILRARCFYFARKHNTTIDFESYKRWRLEQKLPSVAVNGASVAETQVDDIAQATRKTDARDDTSTQGTDQPAAPYPSSFSQIVDLITKGEPIPGIKDIPETLLAGQESSPGTAKRKKPWEKDQAREEINTSTLEGDE